MSSILQKKKFTKLFNALDINGNGVVTHDDFIAQFERFATRQKLQPGTPQYDALREEQRKQWITLQVSTDTDNNGEVTVDEYIKYAERVVSNPEAFEYFFIGSAAAYFDSLDNNSDGTLTSEEFKGFVALSNAGEEHETNHEETFKLIDANGDGKISKDEFLKLFRESILSENPNNLGNKVSGVK
jgi:Ca2+-binding EF-hand superfamily protein